MMIIFLALVIRMVMGLIASHFAEKRGRSPVAWFWLGFCFDLIALLILFILRPLPKPIIEKSASVPQVPAIEPELFLKQWFYLDTTRTQQGPVPFEKLQALLKERVIHTRTYIWSEGMEGWKRLGDFLNQAMSG